MSAATTSHNIASRNRGIMFVCCNKKEEESVAEVWCVQCFLESHCCVKLIILPNKSTGFKTINLNQGMKQTNMVGLCRTNTLKRKKRQCNGNIFLPFCYTESLKQILLLHAAHYIFLHTFSKCSKIKPFLN